MTQRKFFSALAGFVTTLIFQTSLNASILTINDATDLVRFGDILMIGGAPTDLRGRKTSINDGNDFFRLKDTKGTDEWGYNTGVASNYDGSADIIGPPSYTEQYNDKDFIQHRDDELVRVDSLDITKRFGIEWVVIGLSVQDNGAGEDPLHRLSDFRFGTSTNGLVTNWDTQVSGEKLIYNKDFTIAGGDAGSDGTFGADSYISLSGSIQPGTNADILFYLNSDLLDGSAYLHIFAAIVNSSAGPDRFFRVETPDGGFGGEGDPVPEPGAIAIWSMIGLGAIGGAAWRRRRSKAA